MGDEKEAAAPPAPATTSLLIRTFTLAVAITVAGIPVLWSAEPGAITSLHAIHSLTKDDARTGLPVLFEATVTYYNRSDVDLFVQDGDEAIYVETKPYENLLSGRSCPGTGKDSG